MNVNTTLRVARPTVRIEALLRFYRDGLGLVVIGSFQDHEGFDGLMLGMPGSSYHLEFTCKRGHDPGRAPTQDNLLVFYLSQNTEWQAAVDRMVAHGFAPTASFNPYWDISGRTFDDPDGYRVVLQNGSWSTNK